MAEDRRKRGVRGRAPKRGARWWWVAAALPLVAGLAFLAGPLLDQRPGAAGAQFSLPGVSALRYVHERPVAPNVAVTANTGESYRLSDRSDKVRVLFFTAPG